MKHLLIILALLISVTLITAGCSRQVPLGGRITFEDNGEPLTEGAIAFVSGTHQARSEIDKDGKYTLGFQGESDGLPKGEYRVYIQAVHVETQRGTEKDAYGEPVIVGRTETPLIAAKYTSPDTSGLTFTVDGKTKTFDIEVERAPAVKTKR
jgi:hypothetical protein